MKTCTKWFNSECRNCPKVNTCPVVINFTLCAKLQNIKSEDK